MWPCMRPIHERLRSSYVLQQGCGLIQGKGSDASLPGLIKAAFSQHLQISWPRPAFAPLLPVFSIIMSPVSMEWAL